MCDLEKIGLDFRHHTFFEMLGNWSFNDYGKPQACEWALDFLVNELQFDQEKIVVTYHSDSKEEDNETKEIWRNLGISTERIRANHEGDNFWEMGDSGPCGMSTEIFYPVAGDDRKELLEIWNLVFIDRQRLPSGGHIVPLKSKFVDTGMGLERVLSVLEGVDSNYDTDLFQPLFRAIKAKSSVPEYKGTIHDELDINYRVLADHCRLIAISLSDGIGPGRRGASFTLRSTIKKCILISRDVFHQENPRYLLFDLVDEVTRILSEAYPELQDNVKLIRRTIQKESKRYLNYLSSNNDKLESEENSDVSRKK